MSASNKVSSARRHRLVYQTAAFLTMMIVPAFLYGAAESGANGWIRVLLGIMTAGMILAMWAS